MYTNSNIDFDKISQKSSDKTEMLIEQSRRFCRKKSFPMTYDDKNTSDSANTNKRNEMGKILFEIMNKLFSARVVLERLPSPVVQKSDPAEMRITRNKNKRYSGLSETTFRRTSNAYLKVCQKCEKLFARRKIHCDSCNIKLLFECQRCHKQFTTYRRVEGHVNSKCFLKGYYHCSACDYKTITSVRVIAHMAKLHPTIEYNKETIKWTDARKAFTHKCSKCGKKFDEHEFLNKHIALCNKAQEIIKIANSNKQIEWNKDFQKMIIKFCPKCKEDTKVYDGGVSSVQPCQKCGSAMKFKCSRCNREYEAYSGCRHHTKQISCNSTRTRKCHPRYGSENTIHCPHCKKPFVQEVRLEKHVLQCNGRPHRKPRDRPTYKHLKVNCKRCREVQRICDRRKICEKCKSSLHFECKTCDRNFSADYDSWCQHLKTLFDQTKYVCNDCGLGVISRNTLLKHVKICSRESFHCDQCKYTTQIKHRLRSHVLLKHPILKS